jgi:hypothetical protein
MTKRLHHGRQRAIIRALYPPECNVKFRFQAV